MKYAPIIKRIDNLFAQSSYGHLFLFKALELILPRTWHIKRELFKWRSKHSEHQHILDAGSGLGQYSYMLSKMNPNWSIEGLDSNPQLVAHCNQVFRNLKMDNVIFKTCDLEKHICTNQFDLILATDLAEYLQDDKQLFKNLYDGLKPGGSILLYTHLIDSEHPQTKRARFKLVDEQFRNGYTAPEIKAKLQEAGFTKISKRFVFGPAGTVSWHLSIFYPLKMLNTSFAFAVILPIYYLIALPIVVLLNYIDSHTGHLSGTAIVIKARKN